MIYINSSYTFSKTNKKKYIFKTGTNMWDQE